MEFSTCLNCGEPIFFGIKTEGAGHHGGPNEWRHVKTQNMKCEGVVPHAMPPHETYVRVRVQEVGPLVKEGKWPFTKDKYWDPLTSEWKEAFRKAGFAPTWRGAETVEYTRKGAFERMLVCTNRHCSAYGDDVPDWAPGDIRCLMCGTSKDHWTSVPFKDLKPDLQKSLRDLELVKN